MSTDFRVKAIEKDALPDPATLSEAERERLHAVWVTADTRPGYPCRVSLVEADVGERVLLLPFEHHGVDSPYRAAGPVFVREQAVTAELGINEIPEILKERLLSIRAYDRRGFMVHAEVFQGRGLENVLHRQFLNEAVEYLHIHNANPGCFNCSVHRA